MTLIAFVQPVLAVDIGEILVGLVALIFVIIRQLLEANKNVGAANRAKLPVVPKPQPQQPNKGAAPEAAAGQQADPLRAQVEEFLRRAGQPGQPAQQPRPPQRPPQQAPAREVELLVNRAPQSTEQRNISQPLRQAEWRNSPQPSTQSAGGPDKPRPPRDAARKRGRQSVAEHVAETVSARAENLAKQASKLGQRIAAEDQQFDVQIKSKFDHTIGTLSGGEAGATSEQTPPTTGTPAAQLATMLANPTGIRQAVLVNEILRRPSDRW